MVTTVANALFDRLIEAFPPDQSYHDDQFSDDPMPQPVSQYLAHLMQTRLQDALPDPDKDTWIDAGHTEVQRAKATYQDVLARHQRIPSDEWADTLRRACRDTVRFLIRPSTTLADVIFAREIDTAAPEAVYFHLGFFPAYPYFREVIEAYFKQKDIARIDRERFEGLVNRIDRQMTGDYGPGEWRRLVQPLVTVLGAAGYTEEIPIEILKAFLHEKGAEEHLSRLKKRYGLDGFVPVEEMTELFRDEPDSSPQRSEREAVEAAPRERGAVPLWKQFEQGTAPAAEKRVAEPSTRSSAGSSEPLWKQFRKTPEPNSHDAESPLTELEQAVLGPRGARNRDLFVNHLFSGKKSEYESALRKLQRAESWSHASQIIAQEVFLKHQVNIYSEPAVAFTDAAESKYRS